MGRGSVPFQGCPAFRDESQGSKDDHPSTVYAHHTHRPPTTACLLDLSAEASPCLPRRSKAMGHRPGSSSGIPLVSFISTLYMTDCKQHGHKRAQRPPPEKGLNREFVIHFGCRPYDR